MAFVTIESLVKIDTTVVHHYKAFKTKHILTLQQQYVAARCGTKIAIVSKHSLKMSLVLLYGFI